jgi:hypothetical protein
MHKITIQDFPNLELGDKRRNERFVTILNNVINQPGSSIPKQNESWYDTKATYEFFKNEEVSVELLQKAISTYGESLIGEVDQILIAHDFCEVSYDGLKSEGLGYVSGGQNQGVALYNSIAISDTGIPISLIYQQSFLRPWEELGKAKERKNRPFEEKQSYYWYQGINAVNEILGEQIKKIHIADREADIYDLFFYKYVANTELLLRAVQNRNIEGLTKLWDTVKEQPAQGKLKLNIPDATGKKKTEIEVELRYCKVEILRPWNSKNKYESVEMTAIELTQVSPKQEWQDQMLQWKLLTTIEVNTPEQGMECVKLYCYRWLIERFHYVLKSGTKIEELQLHQATSLQKAIHVYSIAAMKIMQLVYQSRQTPNVSCEVVLTKEQWSVLYILIHKTANLPQTPPTLGEAVKWIGRLGGHLGRKSDGPPGLKTVWLGYQRICDAASVLSIINNINLGKA